MKNIFTDASSAILLQRAGLFESFVSAYHIIMAESVLSEVTKKGHPGADMFSHAYFRQHFKVKAAPDIGSAGLEKLDRGERDTIVLYLETKTGFVITDDGPAARWCDGHDIPFINALLVPKIFRLAGRFSKTDCGCKTDLLIRIGRYSKKVIETARTLPAEKLSFFLPEA